jgi:hypothetical protein
MNELTGITSLPIPSAGINPILRDFLAAATVAKERKAMRKSVNCLQVTAYSEYHVTRVNHDNVT